MSKKVLIISTSPRKGSNSDALAEEFAKGAQEAGHEVEKVSLIGKDIQFCRGCLACQKTLDCLLPEGASFWCDLWRQRHCREHHSGKPSYGESL